MASTPVLSFHASPPVCRSTKRAQSPRDLFGLQGKASPRSRHGARVAEAGGANDGRDPAKLLPWAPVTILPSGAGVGVRCPPEFQSFRPGDVTSETSSSSSSSGGRTDRVLPSPFPTMALGPVSLRPFHHQGGRFGGDVPPASLVRTAATEQCDDLEVLKQKMAQVQVEEQKLIYMQLLSEELEREPETTKLLDTTATLVPNHDVAPCPTGTQDMQRMFRRIEDLVGKVEVACTELASHRGTGHSRLSGRDEPESDNSFTRMAEEYRQEIRRLSAEASILEARAADATQRCEALSLKLNSSAEAQQRLEVENVALHAEVERLAEEKKVASASAACTIHARAPSLDVALRPERNFSDHVFDKLEIAQQDHRPDVGRASCQWRRQYQAQQPGSRLDEPGVDPPKTEDHARALPTREQESAAQVPRCTERRWQKSAKTKTSKVEEPRLVMRDITNMREC